VDEEADAAETLHVVLGPVGEHVDLEARSGEKGHQVAVGGRDAIGLAEAPQEADADQ
jgi:hypothetical protein